MNTLTLTVTGMSCMGCVNSVKNLVGALPGIAGIEIDLASGRVEVKHDPAQADAAAIRSAIEDGGYGIAA
jgi:copper chaperone